MNKIEDFPNGTVVKLMMTNGKYHANGAEYKVYNTKIGHGYLVWGNSEGDYSGNYSWKIDRVEILNKSINYEIY